MKGYRLLVIILLKKERKKKFTRFTRISGKNVNLETTYTKETLEVCNTGVLSTQPRSKDVYQMVLILVNSKNYNVYNNP